MKTIRQRKDTTWSLEKVIKFETEYIWFGNDNILALITWLCKMFSITQWWSLSSVSSVKLKHIPQFEK